jgi:hypothetical protein
MYFSQGKACSVVEKNFTRKIPLLSLKYCQKMSRDNFLLIFKFKDVNSAIST